MQDSILFSIVLLKHNTNDCVLYFYCRQKQAFTELFFNNFHSIFLRILQVVKSLTCILAYVPHYNQINLITYKITNVFNFQNNIYIFIYYEIYINWRALLFIYWEDNDQVTNWVYYKQHGFKLVMKQKRTWPNVKKLLLLP